MDDLIELPDGSLLCGHGFKVCGRCCVDFSFMDESSESPEDSDEEYDPEVAERGRMHMLRALHAGFMASQDNEQSGSWCVFPTKFTPPSTASTPKDLFKIGLGGQATTPSPRFIRRNNPKQLLIYADGACLNNGQANPKAGWAFVFGPDDGLSRIVSARLENKGPSGKEATQTSNRAELRAVIGALCFRAWYGEGFAELVFATDSEYVAEGATSWVRRWVHNGWKTRAGGEVKNKDLWERLLGDIKLSNDRGLKIQFWRIPRALNEAADRAAKQGAAKEEQVKFAVINGVLI